MRAVCLDSEFEDIAAECQRRPGVETGGLLIVMNALYRAATGPGPLATCTPESLQWDASYIAGAIDAARLLTGEVFGRWHAHPSPVILPSKQDKESAEVFRQTIGADEIVDIIVATDAGKPIAWAAYLCTAAGYERVRLDLPTEAAT